MIGEGESKEKIIIVWIYNGESLEEKEEK